MNNIKEKLVILTLSLDIVLTKEIYQEFIESHTQARHFNLPYDTGGTNRYNIENLEINTSIEEEFVITILLVDIVLTKKEYQEFIENHTQVRYIDLPSDSGSVKRFNIENLETNSTHVNEEDEYYEYNEYDD